MTRLPVLLAFASAALLAGCAPNNQEAPKSATAEPTTPPTAAASAVSSPAASPAKADAPAHAHAVLASTSGSDVSGTISFASTDQGVRITGRIAGLKPDSTHGFHIHENGDCSAQDAKSAGGHFNPMNQPHGHPDTNPRHAGDLPNQQADAHGVATVDVLAHDIELGTGGTTDIMGDAIIVHAKPDDYSSQPSGNAGARIACGVITSD